MNRVALDTRADERLQTAAVGNIDPDREQVREVLCNLNIFKKPNRRLGIELNEDINVGRELPSSRAMEPNNAA